MNQERKIGFKNYLSSKGYSENTLTSYLKDLKLYYHFADEMIKKEPLDLQTVYTYFSYLSKNKKLEAASLERKRASLLAYSDYLKLSEKINFLEKDSIISPKKKTRFPNHLILSETLELIKSLDKSSELNHRDFFIVLLFYSTGIRLSELMSLTSKSFNVREGSLKVLGKGNKERIVFLPEVTMKEYQEYLKRFDKKIEFYGTLFFNFQGSPLSVRGVQYILLQISKRLGLDKTLHPHIFRHTFASQMLESGADIRKVAELLGHESLSTTQKYTHLSRKKLNETINRFHPHS